ncbi:MAG TPA: GNAT family N-acetyltransferase [Candidatus Parabacteroides intestinavium]|nr:GNAT family N-acetyltransferase [Candidatus Parabacteroides intestinavium]
MIALRRITRAEDPVWNRLMTLYKESFPPEERRDMHQLEQMLAAVPEMFFNAVEEDGLLCGLASYWDLGDFYYMEHLAVFPEMRNRKIGQQILAYWQQHLHKPQLLEVEPAVEEMACRRIGFYERNGYAVLYKDYVQPSYTADEDACPLWIMGTDACPEIETYIERIKETVYRRPRALLY